jgi:serine/threonine-protein phosphatase 2A regulatory subunit A
MVGSPVLTTSLPSALTSLSSSSPLAALSSVPTTAGSLPSPSATAPSSSSSSAAAAASGPPSLAQISQLIDDLRSPDLPTRLHAFHSLPVIASALGPLRTREELIPYLNEFIDDDDEVLLVLAAELSSLIECAGGVPFAHVLLGPLEHLCATEEAAVRDRAVASVVKIVEVMSEVQLDSYILPLMRKLALAEWFTSRISAAALFPHVYPRLNERHRKDMRALYIKLCTDDTPMVRRAATTHLGPFCLVVDYGSVKAELFPVFQRLSKDEQDSVRLLTVSAAISIAQLFKPADNVTKMLPCLFYLCEDKSWRVRYMVADKYCQLCVAMGGQEVKSDELVDKYVRLLQDEEAEVRTAAAQRVGEVAKLVGSAQTVKKLLSPPTRSPLQALVKDSSQYVRAALASDMMTLSSVLKKKEAVELVVPLFLTLLKDSNSEVRLNLISRLDSINDVMSAEQLSASLLPAIMELAADPKWRVRLQIIEHVPALARQLGHEFFDAKLAGLCMDWLGDSVYSIREAATANLTKLVEVFGVDWAKRNIVPKVVGLSQHRSYLQRLTAVFAIGDMGAILGSRVVCEQFVPVLSALCLDPVPNVRFNCVKVIMALAANGQLGGKAADSLMEDEKDGEEQRRQAVSALIPVVQRLVQDSDNDVKYYAQLCVQALHTASEPH